MDDYIRTVMLTYQFRVNGIYAMTIILRRLARLAGQEVRQVEQARQLVVLEQVRHLQQLEQEHQGQEEVVARLGLRQQQQAPKPVVLM